MVNKNNVSSKSAGGHDSDSSWAEEKNRESLGGSRTFDFNQNLQEFESFDDLHLSDGILRGIYAYGWDKPSPIQSLAIRPMIDGSDILAQAQSGTGKTGAFSVGSLQIIDPSLKKPQILQLSPTRELAHQTWEVATSLAYFLEGVKILKIVGGRNRRNDIQELKRGPQFVVGTPGRVLDLISSGALETEYLRMMCLDEADEMLSRGFQDAMYDIFQFVPSNIQMCLFSATMPVEVQRLTDNFLRNPIKILVKAGKVTLDGIAQYFIDVGHDDNKLETLCDLYNDISVSQAVIFVNSKKRAEYLCDGLTQNDFTATMMHGGMTQQERSLRLKEFKSGSSRVMISTDLLARGIDCQEVSVVINYDLPFDYENYVHRIGRSGRYGKKGFAVNLVTRKDAHVIHGLQQFYQTKIDELPADVERALAH